MPAQIDDRVLEQRLCTLEKAQHCKPRVTGMMEVSSRTAEHYDLFRINPIHYGRTRGLSDADAIDLFIHAANVGLFEMDWHLLCSYCPQVVGSFRELDKVHSH